MLRIEFEAPRHTVCADCGGQTTSLTRFVYDDEGAYAVYKARFCVDHPERAAEAIVALGSWDSDGIPPERVAFALRLWSTEAQYSIQVTDANETAWSAEAILGRKLSREEALVHPWLPEVFHISDHMVADDALLREFLNADSRGPSA